MSRREQYERDRALGAEVRAVLDDFGWNHAVVRAEVESDRLAETVEGCILLAIERAIRPVDWTPPEGPARCKVCDWPLRGRLEDGCVLGNCSYRPESGSPEHRRIQERREAATGAPVDG